MNIVQSCMALKANENALVVTDIDTIEIGQTLAYACRAVGADPVLAIMSTRDLGGDEPPPPIAQAMLASQVIVMATSKSLTHTEATVAALKKGARIASMPSITERMMVSGAMLADSAEVKRVSEKIMKLCNGSRKVRITTKRGTDLEFSVEGRVFDAESGQYHEPGVIGNLPAGESSVAPVEESGEGTLIVDASMASIGLLREPIRFAFHKGRAERIEGGAEAEQLLRYLTELHDPYAFYLGELGIGSNARATVTGNTLEDEKVLGTVHLAIGTNIDLGGKIKSKIHLDGVVRAPTIQVDQRVIMTDGMLVGE